MDREMLEASARKILLGNLREGRSDWEGREFKFVCPANHGYPFQWFWDTCFQAIALVHWPKKMSTTNFGTLL